MSETYKYKYFELDDEGYWVLKHDLTVNVGPFTHAKLPKGFRTNFASIPWPFTKLIDPDDDSIAIPAACHDGWVGEFSQYISITYQVPIPGGPRLETMPNWDRAANDLKKLMFGFRAKPWKRFLVYWAVRYYGIYRRYKHDKA